MRTGLIIAIDGPSGAGKGTVARGLAARLRYRHIDTGAMYRAVAWAARRQGVDLADEPAIAALTARLRLEVGDGVVRVDGEDIAAAIRTPGIDAAASAVARQQGVRETLNAQQRQMGRQGSVGDRRTRHRHGGVSGCRRQGLPRCGAGGAGAAPGARSTPRRGPDGRGDRRGRHRARSARSERSHAIDGAARARRRCRHDRHGRACQSTASSTRSCGSSTSVTKRAGSRRRETDTMSLTRVLSTLALAVAASLSMAVLRVDPAGEAYWPQWRGPYATGVRRGAPVALGPRHCGQ